MRRELGDPVRHEQHDAVGLGQQVHSSEQVARLVRRQCGIRLVEQEHPRVARQGTADLDPLLNGERHRTQRTIEVWKDCEVAHERSLAIIE